MIYIITCSYIIVFLFLIHFLTIVVQIYLVSASPLDCVMDQSNNLAQLWANFFDVNSQTHIEFLLLKIVVEIFNLPNNTC